MTALHLGINELAEIVAGGALIAAARSDIRLLVIPNRHSLLIALAWTATLPSQSLAVSGGELAIAALVFAVGLALFVRGWWGGGDVKLLAAVTLWAGPSGLALLLQATALTGAGLALLMLARLRRRTPEAWRMHAPLQQPMPFGVAIAAGGLAILAHRLG